MKTEASLWTLDQAWISLGVQNETNEAYHKSVGLSCSGLKQLAKTPAHYRASRERDEDETDSQRVGTLTHMAILEPERFAREVIKIEGHRGKTDVKAAIAEAESRGLYVCKPEEFDGAQRMADAIFKQQSAYKLMTGGKPEQSVRWRDKETGVLLKCRPDYLRADGVIVDVKTYDDLSDASVQRQIMKMRYHWQSSFYLAGVKEALGFDTKMFAHLFVDTKAFVARVVVLDDASLEKAEFEMRPLIQKYAESLKADQWVGYPDEIATVSLPSYAW